MKKSTIFLFAVIFASASFVSCEKKPLTLDENTSMKTLLNASDKEIADLVIKEATEKAKVPAEDLSVEYILRDEDSNALAVKIKNNNVNKK